MCGGPGPVYRGGGDGGELMMRYFLSAKQFAVHVKPLVAGGMCAARAGPRTPRSVSTARLSFERADNGLKCEAARATVVWTELLLLVQRAEAEHSEAHSGRRTSFSRYRLS